MSEQQASQASRETAGHIVGREANQNYRMSFDELAALIDGDKRELVGAAELVTATAIGCWDGQQSAYFVGREELDQLHAVLSRHRTPAQQEDTDDV